MISKRAKEIQPSLTLSLSAKIKALQREGVDIVSLGAGEPDFPTPKIVQEKAIEAIQKGFTKYTPAAGIPELRERVAQWFTETLGVDYEPSEVVISCGAKHTLYNVMLTLLNDGDEVIIPLPYWLSYPEQIKLAGGKAVILPTSEETHFKITPLALERAIQPKTKALILNTPSNPTGMIYTEEELEPILEIIEKHNMFLISDEIYSQMVYDQKRHISPISLCPDLKDRILVVNGVSKAYSMTGWRIGFLASPKEIAQGVANIQSHTTSNPCSIAQYAALAALQLTKDEVRIMVNEFEKRRNLVYDSLKTIEGMDVFKPEGAFYIFPSVKNWVGEEKRFSSTVQLAEALLEKKGVGVIPGEVFGASGYIRISFAASEKDLERGMERIKEFLEQESL
ncbi:MAG: pyridoxal phosphate-dependent aminotransferase [Planctomycetota bacterium]|nr:MAG: pyridoxal phosphate-dependent aminotransferase [Planctomycetota bacterium]